MSLFDASFALLVDAKAVPFRTDKLSSQYRFFWLQMSLTSIIGILFVITLIWRNWVELIFNIDPDQGNGSLEWMIVSSLLVVTLVLFALASYQWRRARLTSKLPGVSIRASCR